MAVGTHRPAPVAAGLASVTGRPRRPARPLTARPPSAEPRRATVRRARHGCQPLPRRAPRRPSGGPPGDRPGARRRHRPPAPRPASADGPVRVRAGRHPQPAHLQGDRARLRRHRRARGRVLGPRVLRRARHDEGDERHRHDAAARRVPEGADGAAPGAEVDHGGVRIEPPRPGPVHRDGHPAEPAHGRVREGRRRDRGLPAGVRPPPARRLGDGAALRQLHRPARRHGPHALLRAAGRPHRARLRRPRAAAARGGRARGAGAGRDGGPARRLQRGRRRGAAAVAGDPARREGPAARAQPRRGTGEPDLPRRPARRLLARADALPQLRAGGRHDPAAPPVRVHPRWTTTQAFDDYVRGRALTPVLGAERIEAAEHALLATAHAVAGVVGR